jgi:hypothetical protein
MSTDLMSLWGAIQRGDTHEIASHMFPPSAATARKSLSQGQKDDPTADLGTAEVGTPIVRYWTVRFRHGGSVLWDYAHVVACDPFRAALVVSNRKRSVTETEVVREINRDEFEHLTRSSP